MFCSTCGKQLPDGVKFCNNCGTQQATNNIAPTQQPAANAIPAPTAASKKSEVSAKKKPNILVILVVVLCAFLLGKLVIAPSMVSDAGNQSSQSQQTGSNNGSTATANNPVYDAIFDDTYIVHFQSFFNMETKSFAMKQADGTIACADYGYKNDVVKDWVETVYIPVSEYTDTQKAEVEATFKSQFASIDALNCCSVTYRMGTNYFTITCTYSNVDQASNYAELYNAGVLQANTYISMSATETALLGQGFIKK